MENNSRDTIEINENEVFNKDNLNKIREYINEKSKEQSAAEKIELEILAIKFKMEDYINESSSKKEMQIFDFVKLYLKTLNIRQKKLATVFEMQDSNLYKYLKGERKLNVDIVFKLSSFSNTQPELWYYIQTRNELNAVLKEKGKLYSYKKYSYKNLV